MQSVPIWVGWGAASPPAAVAVDSCAWLPHGLLQSACLMFQGVGMERSHPEELWAERGSGRALGIPALGCTGWEKKEHSSIRSGHKCPVPAPWGTKGNQ